jgi:hypothetical protein
MTHQFARGFERRERVFFGSVFARGEAESRGVEESKSRGGEGAEGEWASLPTRERLIRGAVEVNWVGPS